MAEKKLKVTVLSDTSKFDTAIKSAKAVTKDFANTADSALTGMSQELGVNTDLVNKLSRAMKALAKNPLFALGSAAIAAIAAGFKALNSEAEAWSHTLEGVRNDLQDTAYINTYKQAMHDANKDIAKSWDEMWDNFKQKGSAAIANFRSGFVKMVRNVKDGMSWGDAFKSAVEETKNDAQEAEKAANTAATLAGKIYDTERKQKDMAVQVARVDAQIAELRERASDTTLSATERLAAQKEAIELVRKKYELQVGLANHLADLMQEQVNLVSSTPDEIDRANDARVTAINLTKQMNDELRSMNRLEGTLSKSVRSEFLDSVKLDKVNSPLENIGLGKGMDGLYLPIRAEFDFDAWKEAQKQVEANIAIIKGIAEDAFNEMGTIVGELVGDLITGGDAWDNFKTAALSAFADMATSVGKIAIATGVATLGIKAALESLNGYAAIAAGVALVALGSAVKAGLSNVASGGTVSSAAVATSSGSSSSSMLSSDYSQKTVNVKVTGTLKASGSNLVAVLNNENNRKQHTT